MNPPSPSAHAVVRPVTSGDLDRWLPLWSAYNEFYGRTGPTALSDEVTEQTWSRFLDPQVPVFALVAELGDELVGLAHYLFHPSTTALGPVCYLQDLFTAPAARGAGIATSLIAKVAEVAEGFGAGRVYWQTHESNQRARRLYDAVGEATGFIIYRKLLRRVGKTATAKGS